MSSTVQAVLPARLQLRCLQQQQIQSNTHNRALLHISKFIWSYLLSKQIAMSAEYLPSARNVHADWESRNAKDNLEWKVDASVFQGIVTNSGSVCIQTLPPTSLIHCMETRPGQHSSRCIPASLGQGVRFCFSSIQFDKSGSKEDPRRKNNHLIVIPTWQTQPWYAQLLKMSVQPPFLLDKSHPLVETGSLRLAVWKVSGKVCKWKEFEAMLANLSHIQGEKAQQLITNRPGVSGLAGVMKNKLIFFKHL